MKQNTSELKKRFFLEQTLISFKSNRNRRCNETFYSRKAFEAHARKNVNVTSYICKCTSYKPLRDM